MTSRSKSAKPNSAIAAAFPEVAENLQRIERLKAEMQEQMHYARTGGYTRGPGSAPSLRLAPPPYTAPSYTVSGLIDPHLRTSHLARDAVENRLNEFGGRGHQATVAGLIDLHLKQCMPSPKYYMPSQIIRAESPRESRLVAEITARDQAKPIPSNTSPFTKPMTAPRGRKMKRAHGRKEASQSDALASMYSKSHIPHDFKSPLTWDERNFLKETPWLAANAALDAHDKAVLEGMPYRAHKLFDNDKSIAVLGRVLKTNKEPDVLRAAITALGDQGNLGKNTCLAHLVPQMKSPHPQLRAAALKSIAQVSLPGEERQYCEVELTVWGATNLPKKDRFGACDAYVITSLVTPHSIRAVSASTAHREDDEDKGERSRGGKVQGGGRGFIRETKQTRIIWRDLNPVWKDVNNYHILDPEREVFEFSVWDEDGESDDMVGTASLPLYMVPFDQVTGEMPTVWLSLGLVDASGEAVLGYDKKTLENDGKPTKLKIKARYVSYLRPSDLMDGLVEQLEDHHPLPRIAAAKALKALAPADGNEALLAAIKMLRDESADVRNQAVRDCQWCAHGCEKEAVQLLGGILDEGSRQERMCALQAFAAVCDGGKGKGEYAMVVRALAERLESDKDEVRCAVVDGLAMVAKRGDPLAVDEVCRRFGHPRGETREAAVLALSKVGRAGDEVALEDVAPLLEDPMAAVRHAAVIAVFQLGDVGANTGPTMEALRDQAYKLLRTRVDGNQGRGDLDVRVKESAQRLADKLERPGQAYYHYSPTKEGMYSQILPAMWVKAGSGLDYPARSIPVTEFPKDNKFNSSLPYRPPSPPWDERSQEKQRLRKMRENFETEINVAEHQLRELMKSDHLGELEMAEVKKLQQSIQAFKAQDEQTAEEYLKVAGPVEEQPGNTTKLGFTVELMLKHGDHCSNLVCGRSKYY